MKNHRLPFFALCISALLTVTACSKEDLTTALSESAVAHSQPSFDQTAAALSEILLIARENNWFSQSELIIGLIQKGPAFIPTDIAAVEAGLGIPYSEFHRLMEELGTASAEYTAALNALNLNEEALTDVIRDAVSSSAELQLLVSTMVDAQGRCFLQDACYLIGGIVIEAYLFFCNLLDGFFCEEEVLPLYVFVQEICGMITC